MRRSPFLFLTILSFASLFAEVKTMSFEEMVRVHVRHAARQEFVCPSVRGATAVTNDCGAVLLAGGGRTLPLGVHRLRFRDSDGFLELRDAEDVLEDSFAPTSSTPTDWVRALFGREDDASPFWNVSYVVTEWLVVSDGYEEPRPPAAPRRAAASPAPLTNLAFTAFSVDSRGLMSYALAWPPSLLAPGTPVDVYGTRSLRDGRWSLVDTHVADSSCACSNRLDKTAIPGWRPSEPPPHDASCFVTTNVVEDPLFGDTTSYTNVSWNCGHKATGEPPGFLKGVARVDADGDGLADAWDARRDLCDTDCDGTPDVVELGSVELLPDDGFLWFDVSGTFNFASMNQDSGSFWTSLWTPRRYGRRTLDSVQMCLDGFLNAVPDVNWPQGQVSSFAPTNDLRTTDFSLGGLTVMALPEDLSARVAWRSGMYCDTVVTNGHEYDVFEWKDVGADSGARATFEAILPVDEPDTVYVSYLSVDEGLRCAGRRFGVQDASRQAAGRPGELYAVSRLGAADFPRSRQTVRYVFGLNTDPRTADGYSVPVLPEDSNPEAYYTVRVSASEATLVTFTGDGPSDLPDPRFVLPAGGEANVMLLKGKGYAVGSTAPVLVGVGSDPAAEVTCTDAGSTAWTVELPLGLGLVEDRDGEGNGFSRVVEPPGLSGTFSWTGGCRPVLGDDGLWTLRCGAACGCGRCDVTGSYAYEGYVKSIGLGYCLCPPEDGDERSEIVCVDTVFNNDDSDRISGRSDSELGASTAAEDDPLKDDDLVPVTVTFGVRNARGSARIETAGGKLRFWDSKAKTERVRFPKTFDDVELPYTFTCWMEATDVSGGYGDQSITLSWRTASGSHSGSAEKRITAVEPVVEPVCAEEKEIGGERHVYNPSCLVNDGRLAFFKASWTPVDYPASRVRWSADDPAVRFVGGSTGPEVRVCATGAAETNARIGLQFGDALSAQPSFGVKVVEPRRVRVYIVPVVQDLDDNIPVLNLDAFAKVNEIFDQCGISFVCVNCPAKQYDEADLIRAEKRSTWEGLAGTCSKSDGIIIYVVDEILGAGLAFSFGLGEREIVAGKGAKGFEIAHEIGHAFSLNDIYCDSHENAFGMNNRIVYASDWVLMSHFEDPYDRNGGRGTRYYPPEFLRTYLIPRLLMYGTQVSSAIDLPLGRVKGVRSEGANAAFFEDKLTDCGAEGMLVHPAVVIEE